VVAQACSDEVEDLALARGELWEGLGGVGVMRAGEEVDDASGDAGAVDGLSRSDGQDRADHLVTAPLRR
jgi:hypothetical protein